MAPGASTADLLHEAVETAPAAQEVLAPSSDGYGGADASAPDLLSAAVADDAAEAAEIRAVPAYQASDGWGAGDQEVPEPDPSLEVDDCDGGASPDRDTLPVSTSPAAPEAGGLEVSSARLHGSDASADLEPSGPGSGNWQAEADPLPADPSTGRSPDPVETAGPCASDALDDRLEADPADDVRRADGPPFIAYDVDAGHGSAFEEAASSAPAAVEAAAEPADLSDGMADTGQPDDATPDRPSTDGLPDDAGLEPFIPASAETDLPGLAVVPAPADEGGAGQVGSQPDGAGDAESSIDDAPSAAERSQVPIDLPEQVQAEAFSSPIDGAAAEAQLDAVTPAMTRKPGEYRPRLNRARTRRAAGPAAPGGGDMQNLGADLLMLIGAADWGVQLSALLRTPAGAGDEVAVDQGGVEIWLGQLDDQLLEPLALTDASAAFGEPLLVTAVGLPARWSRTSRDLHVLGPHARVAGFASQARVVIGQESVVICREGLADAARAQILATGSADPVRIEGPNVPLGWVCWRGVRPVRPSSPVGGQAILDALDPLPSVSIELSGGIQLSRAVWLEGHPPSIRLLGLLSEADPVLIDGTPASPGGDGGWTADGWDTPGMHSIHHGGKSAGFSIQPGAGAWEWWPGWEGATRLAGALSDADGREYFHHSGAASLLGARPGQICGFAPSAFGIAVARPEFEPVWLLTAASGVRRGSASMIGSAPPPGKPVGSRDGIERWVRAVCGSGRAGADRSEERAAWSGYVAAARSHRKRRR